MTIKKSFSVSTVLFFIFLVLKLTNQINWSWWWVTVPLWGGYAIVIIYALLFWSLIAFLGFILTLFGK